MHAKLHKIVLFNSSINLNVYNRHRIRENYKDAGFICYFTPIYTDFGGFMMKLVDWEAEGSNYNYIYNRNIPFWLPTDELSLKQDIIWSGGAPIIIDHVCHILYVMVGLNVQ